MPQIARVIKSYLCKVFPPPTVMQPVMHSLYYALHSVRLLYMVTPADVALLDQALAHLGQLDSDIQKWIPRVKRLERIEAAARELVALQHGTQGYDWDQLIWALGPEA